MPTHPHREAFRSLVSSVDWSCSTAAPVDRDPGSTLRARMHDRLRLVAATWRPTFPRQALSRSLPSNGRPPAACVYTLGPPARTQRCMTDATESAFQLDM
eukprot:scaffold2323_cov329-Prasinococcus_capsulatus_cf.AAC.7